MNNPLDVTPNTENCVVSLPGIESTTITSLLLLPPNPSHNPPRQLRQLRRPPPLDVRTHPTHFRTESLCIRPSLISPCYKQCKLAPPSYTTKSQPYLQPSLRKPRKPKNARSKRAMDAREPKEIEDPRTAIFVKGTHTGEVVNGVMNELVRAPWFNYCLRLTSP